MISTLSLPPSLIEGGEAGRQGTLNFITSSKAMLDGITAAVITESGNHDKDEVTLKSIYDALNLAQDPNFVTQRLTLHIQEDVKTRIKAGQIPQNVSEILLMNESEPAAALTAVPPSMIESDDGQPRCRQNGFGAQRPILREILRLGFGQSDQASEPTRGSERRTQGRKRGIRDVPLSGSAHLYPDRFDAKNVAEGCGCRPMPGHVLQIRSHGPGSLV